jgi:hypothetical protein
MIQIHTFKKKGKEEGEGKPQLGGQWKVPSLVVNGEAFCLVANGSFQCLMALGRFQVCWPLGGEGKISFSPPSIFDPIQFYLNLFSIDFKNLFYHGSKSLFCFFPSISFTYKL